eukprot:Rhum_TRINITY_DN2056_c0_g1::Rhum_TRINITY_DN2056_c0_g1_i1::g.5670::m.5670
MVLSPTQRELSIQERNMSAYAAGRMPVSPQFASATAHSPMYAAKAAQLRHSSSLASAASPTHRAGGAGGPAASPLTAAAAAARAYYDPSTSASPLASHSPLAAARASPASPAAASRSSQQQQQAPRTPTSAARQVTSLSPLSPFSPETVRPAAARGAQNRRGHPPTAPPPALTPPAGASAATAASYRHLRPPSLTLRSDTLTSLNTTSSSGSGCGELSAANSSCGYDSSSTADTPTSGLLVGGQYSPLQRFPTPVAPPTPPAAAAAPQTAAECMQCFAFGDPPSPTSARAMQEAPPVGKPSRPAPRTDHPEEAMARFAGLAARLSTIVASKEPGADLLPHLSASEVVKQLVRRMNGFTDSGSAREAADYRGVYAVFQRLVDVIFKKMGGTIRSSALVDLLGCVFDMQLAHDYCKAWVSLRELRHVADVVRSSADPAALFSALLLMIRQQCAQINPATGGGVDKTALSLCIGELLSATKVAAKQNARDPAGLLKDLYRFTDAHDSHWSVMKRFYSLADDPEAPSPLGAVYFVVVHIVAYAGLAEVRAALGRLEVPQGSRLGQIVDQAYRNLLKEKERRTQAKAAAAAVASAPAAAAAAGAAPVGQQQQQQQQPAAAPAGTTATATSLRQYKQYQQSTRTVY